MLKSLILFAHPHPQRSRVNSALRWAIHDLSDTRIHDLYEEYPDFHVDVEREQEKLLAHDLVVFQHPLYWYSSPPLLKEWQDSVLENGWAHGKGGDALRGKYWLQAVSMVGSKNSYTAQGSHRFPITEFLKPFEGTAHACGMIWLPPFITYGTSAMDRAAITAQGSKYREYLIAIRQGNMAHSLSDSSSGVQ